MIRLDLGKKKKYHNAGVLKFGYSESGRNSLLYSVLICIANLGIIALSSSRFSRRCQI